MSSTITLESITRGTISRPPRIILAGSEKIGKSTFAAGSDSPIFIPIRLEEGIDDLDVDKFPVCTSFDMVIECLTFLADNKHKFKTVVIDSGSTLERLIWEYVCKENNWKDIEAPGYGKGYNAALDVWADLQNALDDLRNEKGMGSIIIFHTKVKRFDDPERASYDRYILDVNEKVASAISRWADFIGFANYNIATVEEDVGFNKKKLKARDADAGNRYLFTQNTPAHPGGGRGVYGRLPSEILLDWGTFMEEVSRLSNKPNTTPKKTK